MLITIVSFLFVFAVITLVHEFGHLVFSKLVGIRVYEFGLGFGPTLYSFEYHQTTYRLNLLPILGYVKIAGIDTEDPKEESTPSSEKYFNRPVLSKFISIFSGPLMNLLLGFIVFSVVFAINGIPTGISNEIATISPGSVASKIGLHSGDKLISIDGKYFKKPEEAIALIHKSADKELRLSIQRGKETLIFAATPKYNKRMKIGLVGFSLKVLYRPVNFFEALFTGLKNTVSLSLLTLLLLGRLFIGQLSLGDLAGPVGIAQITGQYAQLGITSFLSFLAFFSINVAVLNLLPLPALDGGRLFFIVIEFFRRKALPIETENKIHYAGLLIFLLLFIVLTINDVLRIFRS